MAWRDISPLTKRGREREKEGGRDSFSSTFGVLSTLGSPSHLFAAQLYQKYTKLFEGEWVAFTEQIGASSLEEMHDMLAKDMSEEEQSSQFYEGLLASMEYQKFVK